MRRNVVSTVFVVGMLAALMSVTPIVSVAQTPTPEAGPGPDNELCTPAQLANEETGVVIEPPETGGAVESAAVPGHVLWVVAITLQPQSCKMFHTQEGPVTLFVQSGSIEYAVHSEATPAATVMTGNQGGAGTPVALDTFVPLPSGDWLTQDRAAWFTYRNVGPNPAVVLMAAWVTSPTGTGCGGGCHVPPKG